MSNSNDKFEWFSADEANPIGKYKQPKPNTNPLTAGYPQTDINKDGILVKGRWPAGTKMKSHMDIRGAGAATKGKQFMSDEPDAGE